MRDSTKEDNIGSAIIRKIDYCYLRILQKMLKNEHRQMPISIFMNSWNTE